MTEETRCPRCGKRLTVGVQVCSACGYEFLPHLQRIRCGQCGRRIPADAVICPRCGADPGTEHRSRARWVVAGIVGAFLVVCLGWVVYRALTTDALARALGFALPTSGPPTQVIQVIYVIATTAAPTPTLTPIPIATATARFSPTPTRRGAPTATLTPKPTPAARTYAAPQLAAPPNGALYTSANANIVLEWQPVAASGLRENEWYQISVTFTGRDGKPVSQIAWSKETRWAVRGDWWSQASLDNRTFQWQVMTVQIEGIDPYASPTRAPLSPLSAVRTFVWQ